MKKKFILFSLLFCLANWVVGQSQWVSLFDGKTFNGWSKHGGEATYEIRDGAIWGINGPGHNTFLCTDKTYGDFELEFDVLLLDPINSGVQIRSMVKQDGGKEVVCGPQVEIEQGPAEAGYLYGEKAGGWMTPKEKLIVHDVFKNDDWNHYRIVARGPRIQTYINGRQISDLVDHGIFEQHAKGLIGLQVHSIRKATAGTLKIAWKNIRIRETDMNGWTSIFNGKNLDGWIPKVRGHKMGENPGQIFRAENGVLKVTYDAFDDFGERFGHLFYHRPFSNYILRLEYRFVGDQVAGGPKWAYRNNGVMIHGQSVESMELNQKFPDSIEVQLLGADPGQVRTTGNICTPGTKFYQKGELKEKHCYTSDSLSYVGDQWVQAEIHVFGSNEVVHYINGQEVMRYQFPQKDDGSLIEAGTISFQAESHDTEFRNIEIKVLQ